MHKKKSKTLDKKPKVIHLDTINYLSQIDISENRSCDKETFKQKIAEKLNFSLEKYNIYFINNLYESYFSIINAIIKSFSSISQKPHILSSNIEHPYIVNILNDLKFKDVIELTYISTNIYGSISTEIEPHIKPNKTCLILVPFLNYLTGSVNNLKKIGEIAHKYKIPVFSDCTFVAGKCIFNPENNNMDCFSITFERSDLSLLIIKKKLVEGYRLDEQDIRFQNKIQNFSQIETKELTIAYNIIEKLYKIDRKFKNEKIMELKNHFIRSVQDLLSKTSNNLYFYDEFIKKNINMNIPPKNNDIIVLGHKDKKGIPHIISFIFVSELNDCEIYDKMKKNGILILKNNNYLLFESIGITTKWTKKIVTICINDDITKTDLNKFVRVFRTIISK